MIPNQNHIQSIYRQQIIEAVIAFRREWEDASEDVSLVEVKGNVGLMLADLTNTLGFTFEEQTIALGETLILELTQFLG